MFQGGGVTDLAVICLHYAVSVFQGGGVTDLAVICLHYIVGLC